jgi:hypothetical protein
LRSGSDSLNAKGAKKAQRSRSQNSDDFINPHSATASAACQNAPGLAQWLLVFASLLATERQVLPDFTE